MNPTRLALPVLTLGWIATLSGCAVGPDFKRPAAPSDSNYGSAPIQGNTAQEPGRHRRQPNGAPAGEPLLQSLYRAAERELFARCLWGHTTCCRGSQSSGAEQSLPTRGYLPDVEQ